MAQKSTGWNEHCCCYYHRYYLSLSSIIIIIIIIYKMSLANQQSDFQAMFNPKTHLKLTSRASRTYKIKIPFQCHVFSYQYCTKAIEKEQFNHRFSSFLQCPYARIPHRIQTCPAHQIWQKPRVCSPSEGSAEIESLLFFISAQLSRSRISNMWERG